MAVMSSAYLASISRRFSFIAAVRMPFSGVHTSLKKRTDFTNSSGLRLFAFAVSTSDLVAASRKFLSFRMSGYVPSIFFSLAREEY